MWPNIRQSILQSVQTLQHTYSTHSRLAFNTGLFFILIGTTAGLLVDYIYAIVTNSPDFFSTASSIRNFRTISQCLSLGLAMAVMSSSLIAVHLQQGKLPANGMKFAEGIPAPVWRLYLIGGLSLLTLFTFNRIFNNKLTSAQSYDFSSEGMIITGWGLNITDTLLQITAAGFAILVFLRSKGKITAAAKHSAIASALVSIAWMMVMNSITLTVEQAVLIPLPIIIRDEWIVLVLTLGVSVIVYAWGMLTAAAIASSAFATEPDIEFDNETHPQS